MPHGGSDRMATGLQLKVPEKFNFSKPNKWKIEEFFEQFRVTSGLKQEDGPTQVSTLLYCMGEEADSALSWTNISDADREVRKNVIFEQAKFNRRVQLQGEFVEQFITDLYTV